MRTSAWPATADLRWALRAATMEMALSMPSGPSITAPVIWPRSAILQSAAASSVVRIFGVTVSMPARIATFGSAMPIMCAKSIAFCTISTLCSSVGSMFTIMSLMMIGRG